MLSQIVSRRTLQLLVGAISGGSFGLALAVTGIRAGFLPDSATLCFMIAAVGLVAGFFLTRQLCQDDDNRESAPDREQLFSLLVAFYHAGAAILFAALLVWGFDSYDQWWSGGPNRRYYLQAAILGYGFLRLWTLLRRIWIGLGGSDSLFFMGLIIGTFPPLLGGLREAQALTPILTPLSKLLDPLLIILVMPGRAAAVFLPNTYWYFDPFPEQMLYLILGSLGWGFVFVAAEVLLPRSRRLKRTDTSARD